MQRLILLNNHFVPSLTAQKQEWDSWNPKDIKLNIEEAKRVTNMYFLPLHYYIKEYFYQN